MSEIVTIEIELTEKVSPKEKALFKERLVKFLSDDKLGFKFKDQVELNEFLGKSPTRKTIRVDDLQLSTRLRRHLLASGITTVQQILELGREKLLDTPGLGPASVGKLSLVLSVSGLDMPP